jgi:aldose 1-epimerase
MAKRTAHLLSVLVLISACGRPGAPEKEIVKQGGFTRAPFGHVDGAVVDLFTLKNARGMEVRAMSRGATIVSLRVPDRAGLADDVVLGFDAIEGYLGDEPYFGAVVGRYGNRIAKGRFRG